MSKSEQALGVVNTVAGIGTAAGAIAGTTSELSKFFTTVNPYLVIFSAFFQIHLSNKRRRANRDARAIREISPSSSNQVIEFAYGYCVVEFKQAVLGVRDRSTGFPSTATESTETNRPINNQGVITLANTCLGLISLRVSHGGDYDIDITRVIVVGNKLYLPKAYLDTLASGWRNDGYTIVYRIATSGIVSGVDYFGNYFEPGPPDDGVSNLYLHRLGVLCMDPIQAIANIDVDGRLITNSASQSSVYKAGGTALATANTNLENVNVNNAKFTNFAYAFESFFQERSQPDFRGVPTTRYYIQGRNVRTISIVDSVATLSSARTHTNNAILILLDYLLDANGANLPTSSIDLQSFYDAYLVANATVQTDSSADCKVIKNDTNSRVFKRCEFNGLLPTSNTFIDNIDEILSVIPGGILYRSLDGLLKFSLPDTSMTDAQLSVATLTDADFVMDTYVSMQTPSTEERLNKVTVTYNNYRKDYIQDTEVVTQASLLQADQNIELASDTLLDGVDNQYHAKYIAEIVIRESRVNIYKFTLLPKHIALEIGDVVNIQSAVSNTSARYVRIVEITRNNDFSIEIIAVDFAISRYNYASYSHTAQSSLVNLNHYIETVPYPSGLTATLTASNGLYGTVSLSWTNNNPIGYSTNIYDVVVEFSTDDQTTWYVARILEKTGNTIPTSLTWEAPIAGTYRFRVYYRALSWALRPVYNSDISTTTSDLTITTSSINNVLSGRTITGSTVQTATSGARIVMNTSSLIMYDASDNKIVEFATS